MNNITSDSDKVYCGIDFHKNTSTFYAVYQDGREVEPLTTIRTSLLIKHLANRRNWKIGIEATGGVNHFADQVKAIGHEVVIFNSNKYRGITGSKKSDKRDTRALTESLRLNFVPEVHHRTIYSRRIKSLLTSREHIVEARTGGMNHVRGTLREYGIVMPAGAETFYKEAREKINQVDFGPVKESLLMILDNIMRYREQEKSIESQVTEFTKEDERIKKLQTIPGVGPLTAMMTVAVTDDVGRFSGARKYAAYLGLVPSLSSSADKRMMGSITKSGCEMLRRYLIHGARAWMRYSPKSDRNRIWAEKVKDRRGMNKATVALAHRIARICFAVMRDQSIYKNSVKPSLKQAA